MMIPAVRIGNHDVAVVFDLHALVFDPQCADQLDAADLEPHQIIRVIDHAHLIRLRVAHAHHRVMIFNHSLSRFPAIEPICAPPAATNRAPITIPKSATKSENHNSKLKTKKTRTKTKNQHKEPKTRN